MLERRLKNGEKHMKVGTGTQEEQEVYFLPPKITNNETIAICINTNKIYAHI